GLAGLEAGVHRRGDADLLAGARVAPGAGGTLAHVEGAEAHQGHAVTLLQRLGDGGDHGIDRAAGIGAGQIGRASHGFDEFGFVHCLAPCAARMAAGVMRTVVTGLPTGMKPVPVDGAAARRGCESLYQRVRAGSMPGRPGPWRKLNGARPAVRWRRRPRAACPGVRRWSDWARADARARGRGPR